MRVCVAFAVICVACRNQPCDKFVDLAAKCMPHLPGSTLEEMQLMCSLSVRDKDAYAPAFEACTKATTCDEQKAVFDKWGCVFIFTDPSDRVPQFHCRLTPL